jgi:hypothetical protein
MNRFKSCTFTWLQIGVFKLALLAVGTVIGAYRHEFFRANMVAVIAVAVVASLGTAHVLLRQV